MPNLPNVEVTQAQYDTIMSHWVDEDDFKSWLRTSVIDRVVGISVSALAEDLEEQIQTLRNNIYAELDANA